MKITVGILCVDGETSMELVTPNPQSALSFLTENDHEGSSINVSIDADCNAEEVYKVLEAIQPIKEKKHGKDRRAKKAK